MGGELCVEGGCYARMGDSWSRIQKGLNNAVSKSSIGKYFKLEARKTCFTREVRAGTATFLTMAYIISVNASILAGSGGTCSVSDCTPVVSQFGNSSMPGPDCMIKPNAGYEKCLSKTKNDLIVATCLSSMIASIAMGVLANLPLALAPAMGANAYFAYSLVGFHGSGPMTYQTALALGLVQSCAFLVIAAFGLRARIARLLPRPVRLASSAGIGLFIAFTGLMTSEGLGLIGPSSSTLVTLTACSSVNPVTGACIDGKMQSPTFWLGVVGFLIISYCTMKNVKGSMIYGLIFVTVISWFRGTKVTIFPNTPQGDTAFEYFKKVVDFHRIESTAGAISFKNFNSGVVWLNLITALYVEVFSTTAVLYSLAEIGGFVDEKGSFEGEYQAFMIDASASIVGSALGTSPLVAFVESAAGIREGGRTGITAIVVGFYFFLSLFFVPLLVNVPPWAIGPSLLMVGVLMATVIKDIDWADIKEAVPAFITMLLMPLTYNISYGLIGGIGVYVALHLYDIIVGSVMKIKTVLGGTKNQISAAAATDSNIDTV
ncbi:hypothetical protein Scep_018040 [Stephania cephalantha]|uniref:Uncharacterized protein n=1 Tax=Stephania cephalantha TaxID=152367 RepID=A0AAP0NU69_9MAGN